MVTTAIRQKINNVASLLTQFIERTCTILTMFTPDAPSVSFTTLNGQKNEHDFLLHFQWSLPIYHLYSSSTPDCYVKLGQSVVFSLRQKAVFDSHHTGDMLVLCKSNLRENRFPANTNYLQTQSGQPPSCESVPKTSPFCRNFQYCSDSLWTVCLQGGLGVTLDKR